MRIAYVGHSYHRKTLSTAFLIDILRTLGTVDFFWDESWNAGAAVDANELLGSAYDLIVVFQTETIVPSLAGRHSEIVFVPMYDGVRHRDADYWRSIPGVRVLAFCLAVHESALRHGLHSEYFRYYPEVPEIAAAGSQAGLKGFFWQRNKEVDWGVVRRLISGTRFDAFTLHDAPDPGKPFRRIVPTKAERRVHGIRRTEWFADRRALENEIASADVYFAPRAAEGIGMGFLEAMAMGLTVVAPDRPTMNEYIRHGVNGLLYDVDRPASLDFSSIAGMGRNARAAAVLGRERWLASIPEVTEFLKPSRTVPVANPTVAAFSERRESAPKISFIIPSYHQGHYIGRTLDSIAAQGLPEEDYEVLVFDGGSRDATLRVLESHPLKPRWISGKDGGQADAINRGFAEARGDIIAWLNSDDTYEPGALVRVMEVFARHPETEVVYGRAGLMDENDADLGEYPVLPWDYAALADSCFLCQPAVFFRRSVVARYGVLDASLHYAMDYEYWLRLGKRTPFLFVDAVLAHSRIYAQTKTLRDKPGVFREGLSVSHRHTGRWSRKWLRGLGYWRAKSACARAGVSSSILVAIAVFLMRTRLAFSVRLRRVV